MMKKMFSIVAALLFGLVAVAEPVKSMLGAEGVEMQFEEEEEQNLWVWPTESINLGIGDQNTIRYWKTGIWYIGFAFNGKSSEVNQQDYYFDDGNFHNFRAGSGYSMVQFFLLNAGDYELTYSYICETYSDSAHTFLSFYERNQNHGWIFKSWLDPKLIWRYDEGSYKTECRRFTVPEGTMIGITISGINTNGRRGIDVWDVVLKKVD